MPSLFIPVNTLAIIADAYTPLLLLLALIDIARYWRCGNKLCGTRLIYAVFVVYLWMFIDKYFQLWAILGLDYSTHLAAALALVIVIDGGKQLITQLALASSLVAYSWLMFLLHYHSWSDMGSTLCIVAACLLPIIAPRSDNSLVLNR